MSNPHSHIQQDRQVTRYIHKLFIRAILLSPYMLVSTLILHAVTFLLTNTFIPLQVAYGVQAIVERRFTDVQHIVWVIVFAAIIANIAYALATLAINKLGTRSQTYVQTTAFANFLNKDYEFYGNSFSGELGAKAAGLRDGMSTYDLTFVFNIPRYVVIIVSGIVVIGLQSWLLAVITLGCMAAVMSYTLMFANFRLSARRQLSEASSRVSGVLVDALANAATVKSFGNEEYEMQRLTTALTPWRQAIWRSWNLSIPQNAVRNVLMAFAMAGLLLASSNLYQHNKISLVIVTLVQFYVIRLVSLTADMADAIKSYDNAMAMAHAGAATMLEEASVVDPITPSELPKLNAHTLRLSNVTYAYPDSSSVKAIDNLSITIKPGEKIGVVGYSGSGKTTLTKLLLRFMDVSSGSITISGSDIRQVAQKDLRSQIAYVPQEPLLFHRSLRENIVYGKPNATKSQVETVLKAAYINEFIDTLPQGLDSRVGERGVKLSGGQRQRVAIARALLKDAPVLVLDEATSALDSQSERYIQKALTKLMHGRTSVVVAHRLSTIQHMDRIVVMDKGAVLAIGSHQELIQQNVIYAELWAHQSGGYIGVPEDTETG